MSNQEGFATDLKEAGEVILRLSPKGLCRGALLNSLRDFLTDVAGGVAGDVFRAILALISLGAGLGGFVPVILGALASSAVGGAFKQVLKQLAGKVGEPGSEVVKCFMEFINTAREASRYIDYEEVQGIVSDVAREWGIGTNAFKNLVRGFANLTEGRLVTEDEVRRLFENGLRKVEELEAKVNELNNWINLLKQKPTASITIANKTDFEQGTIYPNIKVKNSELRIRVEDEYHNIVRAGKFNELVNKVRGRLLKQGFVVVVGPKGIGKSTLAAVAIWELLVNGDIGLVARVDVLNEDNYSRFKTFVENYGEEFVKYFGRLLILYDPVSTESYEKVGIDVKAPIQSNIERTIKNLVDFVDSISPKASRSFILIVLPSDIYNALSNDMRAKLESHSLDASQVLINTEFLAELIREYTKTKSNPNGCSLSNDVLSKLTSELAKFDSGHALIARLVGEELVRNNCNVGEVEKLISNAKGKAEAFIIQYINSLFRVHEDPKTAEALVEVFALRRPFVNMTRPGVPILTPGIIKLIGEKKRASLLHSAKGKELRSWLARRQHDLIEESIDKLLRCIVSEGEECKKFDDELLEPWKEAHVPKIRSRTDAVKYFTRKYGKRLIKKLRKHKNCWKRAALIIGRALAGIPIVPRPEDLPSGVVESLGDALNRCGVDDYLLVGDEIPPLIMNLIRNHARDLAKVFIDKYNETVAEVRRILNIARDRGISGAEAFYGLGLASIIAKAVESGKDVESSGADAALHIASFAIQFVALIDLIMPILSVLDALKPLRAEAPHRYLELLALASNMGNLDRDTVGHIFKELKELSEILSSYGYEVEGRAWSLVIAIITYADLLVNYLGHFNSDEVEGAVRKVADLLNELDKLSPSLGVIAWAIALGPALIHGDVRRLMEEKLGIDVVNKANEILGRLGKMRDEVQKLISDKEFMSYIEFEYWFMKPYEEAVKKVILDTASHVLGNCLVSLALTGGDERVEKIKELLEKHLWVLNTDKQASVLTRLTLNALLGLKDRKDQLGSELKDKLSVNPEELINAFGPDVDFVFRPALRVALGIAKPEDAGRMCMSLDDLTERGICMDAISVAMNDNDAVVRLRGWLIDTFRELLLEKLGLLKELGVNADKLLDEFMELVSGLDGKSLVQLDAPINSMARLALMLHALINRNEKLAKAHALYGAVDFGEKLPARLFLEAYRACCDLGKDEFRRAVARLIFLQV